ncbi:hypothetical protein FKV24_009185 [Lysobacter maris]|uniref:Spondin domain-containing protein n=1 Tax=Marilutibacter maris TaxID=1605891 RepID=A0A508AY93_9GAMM|nr:spondin domain-containing protein [Lysobacter maris]KAB8189688.1 hypothetical protein FKV24_009185 [Lysobacter maris]
MSKFRNTFHCRIAAIGIAAVALATSLPAASRGPQHGRHHGGIHYQVEVVNLTRAQQFTPLLVAIHHPSVDVFEPGAPALPELATLAETGNPVPLSDRLDATRGVSATARGDGLTAPGQKTAIAIDAPTPGYRISLAAMMIPTNDGFVGLDAARLPAPGRSVSYTLYAYDAGSEPNDESCASIPGPDYPECNGPGGSGAPEAGAEGFVHTHNGIHGIGDFDAAERDWRNPVARVTIRARY